MVSPLNYLSLSASFQVVLGAITSDSCLLDLLGTLSVRRKRGSSKTQGLLDTSAPSSFYEEFGELVMSDGVLEGQLQTTSRFSFLLHPTSKEKWHIAQKPFQKLSLGAEGVAHRKFPFCSKRLCSLPFDATTKTIQFCMYKSSFTHAELHKWSNDNKICGPCSEKLAFQTWN